MNFLFKTLDHHTFNMEVDVDETVGGLIYKLENLLGIDNLYKVIYSGKLLKEEKLLSEYNISPKIPIIVMVTKTKDTFTNQVEKVDESRSNQESETDPNNTRYDFDICKRTRTVTEDSGFEEDICSGNFVTDAEFKNVIEIIQSCEYLRNKGEQVVSIKDIGALLAKFCEEENIDNVVFDNIIIDKMGDIEESKLNTGQLRALFEDIQGIFDEIRVNPSETKLMLDDVEDILSDESDTEEDMNKSKLLDMGFSDEAAENALKSSSNNLKLALEMLLPTSYSRSSPPRSPLKKSNPLAFLRDIDEFQFLRYLVLQDPLQLQPLLLSFGQSHPDLMKTINENKDIFVSMLHEQTGAKLNGRH